MSQQREPPIYEEEVRLQPVTRVLLFGFTALAAASCGIFLQARYGGHPDAEGPAALLASLLYIFALHGVSSALLAYAVTRLKIQVTLSTLYFKLPLIPKTRIPLGNIIDVRIRRVPPLRWPWLRHLSAWQDFDSLLNPVAPSTSTAVRLFLQGGQTRDFSTERAEHLADLLLRESKRNFRKGVLRSVVTR